VKRRAYVTGTSMICALGDTLEGIVDAARHKKIRLAHLPFTLASLPYSKPYYLIQRDERDSLDNRSEAYFYEILFSAVSRALLNAGVGSGRARTCTCSSALLPWMFPCLRVITAGR
jgi:hypothetical protein